MHADMRSTQLAAATGIFLGILFRVGLLTFQGGRKAWGQGGPGERPIAPPAGSGAEPSLQLWVWGSVVSFPSGVWGEAPTDNKFCGLKCQK
jgi:hypothetical protein